VRFDQHGGRMILATVGFVIEDGEFIGMLGAKARTRRR
jgi:hypothetical protein